MSFPGRQPSPGPAYAAPALGHPSPGHASVPSTGLGPAPSKPIDPLVGQTIDGRYVVEALLGEGGMGVVYRARHRLIERKVALKVLRSEYAKDREIVERFVQEAKTATAIGNEHIVDILDFGQLPDGSTYFAMEYLDGISLTQAIAQKLEPRRIAAIGVQICDGLGAAHAAGIVHRDLKPDNIYLLERNGADFVKVLDFGIAKVTRDAKQKLTRAGAVFGTPHYMSPEQAAGTSIDHRADIYALGVILYEMAAGRLPFDSDDLMGILTQHMYRAPVPIRALVQNTDCPPSLEAIVQKCLEKRPGQRYQSTNELAVDLTRFLRGEVPGAVAELMGKPSQYNVPVDYFRAGTGPMVPATPASASKGATGLIVFAGLLFAGAIAAGAAVFLLKAPADARPAEPAATAAEPAPPEPPPATAAPTVTAEAPPPVASSAAPTASASAAAIASAKSAPPTPPVKTTGPGLKPTAPPKPTNPPAATTPATRPVDPWDGPVKIFK